MTADDFEHAWVRWRWRVRVATGCGTDAVPQPEESCV
jgi:hypothetical protein